MMPPKSVVRTAYQCPGHAWRVEVLRGVIFRRSVERRDAGFVDLRDYCISSVFLARNSDQSFNAFAWSQIPRYLDRVFLIFGHEQTRPASPAFLFE